MRKLEVRLEKNALNKQYGGEEIALIEHLDPSPANVSLLGT